MTQRLRALGALALVGISACQAPTPVGQAPTQAGDSPSPNPVASAKPSQAPGPSAVPSVASGPSAHPSPWGTPSPPSRGTGVWLRWGVFDEDHQAVSDPWVWVQSLDPNQPFSETIRPEDAWPWGFRIEVAESARVAVRVHRQGWVSRTRQLQGVHRRREDWLCDFGSASPLPLTEEAALFALSPCPEVAEVEALPDGHGLRFRLSEPLDEANRKRLVAALRLLPGEEAASSPAALDPEAGPSEAGPQGWRPAGPWDGAGEAPSSLGAVVWNDLGDAATWAWPQAEAPASAARLALVAGFDPIVDGEGWALGRAWQGEANSQPPEGAWLHGAFFLPWPREAGHRHPRRGPGG